MAKGSLGSVSLGHAGRQNTVIPPEEQRSQGIDLPIPIRCCLRAAPEAFAPRNPGLGKESQVLATKPCQHPRNGECVGSNTQARTPSAHSRERRAIFQHELSFRCSKEI